MGPTSLQVTGVAAKFLFGLASMMFTGWIGGGEQGKSVQVISVARRTASGDICYRGDVVRRKGQREHHVVE